MATPLTITLPDDVAEAIKSKVASGEFTSEGELLLESYRYFMREDAPLYLDNEEFDKWLHSEVAPVLEELDADPTQILSAEQVRANMMRTRENFRKAG